MKDVGDVCVAMCRWGLFFLHEKTGGIECTLCWGGAREYCWGGVENTIDTHTKLLVMGYNALLTSI